MNSRIKKSLKLVLPILLGIFLVWYSIARTEPEDREQILHYISQADAFWVGLSIAIGILSHISRAIRWNYLLQPLGYRPSLMNNVLIILMAYLTNLGIPRSGEVLRATALASYENVPFEKGFGTIVTERVVDLLMLFLVIIISLLVQTDIILGFLEERGFSMASTLVFAGIGLGSLLLFMAILRKSSSRFAQKIRSLIKGLLDGVTSIFRMERKWAFLWHTIFIWAAYVAMFWVIKFTVPETSELGLGPILVAFVAGAFAMSTTNGGIGLYPIAVSGALALFGVPANAGDAFGWIMWISQTLMVVLFGAISFILLPLLNRNR